MTRRLVYLASARADLLAILRYITAESGSSATAERFTASLRAKCRQLAELPGQLGRPRPELLPDVRSFVHGGYVIFFRYQGDRLEIIDILEGHRDVDAHFRGAALERGEDRR